LVSAGGTAEVLAVRAAAGAGAATAEEPPLVDLAEAVVGPGAVSLRLAAEPPAGFHLAPGTRASIRLAASGPLVAPGRELGLEADGAAGEVVLRAGPEAGVAALELRLEAVVCDDGDAACWPLRARYRLPLRVDAALSHGRLALALPLPDPRGR